MHGFGYQISKCYMGRFSVHSKTTQEHDCQTIGGSAVFTGIIVAYYGMMEALLYCLDDDYIQLMKGNKFTRCI